MSDWTKVRRLTSSNENVWKYVFEKPDAVAESVLYRYPNFLTRTVICCSTQSGCPVGCRFCGAGDAFVRSLTADEIVSQPVRLLSDVETEWATKVGDIGRIQIMFMSMGEPLLNLQNLVPAMRRLHDMYPKAALLVSTSAPMANYALVRQVSAEIPTIGLQFSVHETTESARDRLIPFKAKLRLREIAVEGELWFDATGRTPFFNYCAHEGNVSDGDADRLRELFDPKVWQATISVICEREEHLDSANARQRGLACEFRRKMDERGYRTRVFDPAGQETAAGCGQLWLTQEWMRMNAGLTVPSVGRGLPVVHTPKPDPAEDVCGLCGKPGADKIPHPVHWPGEVTSDTSLVHAECEDEECQRAHAALSDAERSAFLRTV